jgi:hypothetical protein
MRQVLFLVAVFTVLAPRVAWAAGEAAEVRQMFQACKDSGGVAADNYNAWVAQNGCKCGGSSTGSGKRTCPAASGSAGATDNSGDLVTEATKNVVQGVMNGNSQQAGVGLLGIGGAMLLQGLLGDPAADARRAQEAALAAEQQRQAEDRRRAEVVRQQELARHRILGLLKGSEGSTALALKLGESDTSLTVTATRGPFGDTVAVPTGIAQPPIEHGLQLKLGDDAERASMQARQGFDTAGQISGTNLPKLPDPPPTPTGALLTRRQYMLKSKLKASQAEGQSLKDHLAELQQAPTPDSAAIAEVEEKIVANGTEQQEIMVDLTADDDANAAPAPPQPESSPPGCGL